MEQSVKEISIICENNVRDMLKKAIQSNSKSASRELSLAGAMSIVNTKTGKRITLSKKLLEELSCPKSVQIAFTEDSIIIGEKLPNNESIFNLKMSNGKGAIYSAQEVTEIRDLFDIDFSNKTSITFAEAE
jgi:hypothetical protein